MNWQVMGNDDWNRANPCCCDLPPCPLVIVEIQHRDLEECRYGFEPYYQSNTPEDTGPEPWPDAFDRYQAAGTLIPVYKTRTESWRYEAAGVVTLKARLYGAGDVEVDAFNYTATTSFDGSKTRGAEYGKPREDWPAGNIPAGPCEPLSSQLPPGAPGTLDASAGTPVDGIVPVTLSWADNRHSHMEDGEPVLEGAFEVLVDGTSFGWDTNSFDLNMAAGDESCHEFQVRTVSGSAGPWSPPHVFSLTGNPCCEPEPLPCNQYTEGNWISSVSQNAWNQVDGSWETDDDSAVIDSCDPHFPTDPTGLGLTFNTILTLADPGATGTWQTRTPDTWETVSYKVVNEPNSAPTPDPTDHSWQVTEESAEGTLSVTPPGGSLVTQVAVKTTEKTEFSNDLNDGETTAEEMFSAVQSEAAALDDTWGWGMTIGGYEWPAGASAPAHWPVIGDAAMGRVLRCRYREIRVRFTVPEDHTGTVCRVVWKVARFAAQWLAWRDEYFTWALAKYAYLHKPHPGDPDYPVLADFWDDPETLENEAAEALAAAIAALDAIEDPGAAPEEPVALRPEVIGEEHQWDWTIEQTVQPFETIADCDPTKAAREMLEPTPPPALEPGATPEEIAAHEAAVAAYEEALAEYEHAVAMTARQSPWSIVSPDRYTRELTEPEPPASVPPLGDSPSPSDIAAHTLAVAIHDRKQAEYEAMLEIWQAARRESIQICDVATICSPNSPYGPIRNYDPGFPTTSLPPLDPATTNPEIWRPWWT